MSHTHSQVLCWILALNAITACSNDDKSNASDPSAKGGALTTSASSAGRGGTAVGVGGTNAIVGGSTAATAGGRTGGTTSIALAGSATGGNTAGTSGGLAGTTATGFATGGTATTTAGASSGGNSTSNTTGGRTSVAGAGMAGRATGGAATSGANSGGASNASGGVAGAATSGNAGTSASNGPNTPAVARGAQYFAFAERFNRYYTDSNWQPTTTIYVSPNGSGSGNTRADPASVANGLSQAAPGTRIYFLRGTYSGCYELDDTKSGTYDNPILLYAERNTDGTLGVSVNCCNTGRMTCINLEAADYVALDGFELIGGRYGVRSVGSGYPSNQHQKGTAVLNCVGHAQDNDPFFTGQSDWYVIERCTAYDVGTGDGHGIYLSNGSDWNIARYNETYNTASSDFQINADPNSTCLDDGVAFNSAECDAIAGTSTTGGRGASDFMLIDGNFFHHSLAQGPNFTSVRNSLIRNNIFALPARHGASFWQETDNPRLGASKNVVVHNLFVTQVNSRQALGVTVNSTENQFRHNVFVAVSISGTTVGPNVKGQLLATDATTVSANTFERNAWISGFFGSDDAAAAYVPNATELRQTSFVATWFQAFPTGLAHDPAGFKPGSQAPWLNLGTAIVGDAPTDRDGKLRVAPVDFGPYEF